MGAECPPTDYVGIDRSIQIQAGIPDLPSDPTFDATRVETVRTPNFRWKVPDVLSILRALERRSIELR
jgi:hypothetical protein